MFRVSGFGFRVSGLGIRVWNQRFGLKFKVQGLGFGIQGIGFNVWDLGFGIQGSGFKVSKHLKISTNEGVAGRRTLSSSKQSAVSVEFGHEIVVSRVTGFGLWALGLGFHHPDARRGLPVFNKLDHITLCQV